MYVTGSYRLTPQHTECKHFLKDLAFNSLQDKICLQNPLGGSKPILSHPSKLCLFSFIKYVYIKTKQKTNKKIILTINSTEWYNWYPLTQSCDTVAQMLRRKLDDFTLCKVVTTEEERALIVLKT